MLSPREQNNYARALLNNASCLMPPSLHEALQRIPGGSPSLQRDCGWEPDNRLAVHLLQKASERGSLEAGWILSQFYLGSVDPELQDHRAAYLQLSRTGGLGHASARLMTGIMRWRGDGIRSSAQAAFPLLLRKASSPTSRCCKPGIWPWISTTASTKRGGRRPSGGDFTTSEFMSSETVRGDIPVRPTCYL